SRSSSRRRYGAVPRPGSSVPITGRGPSVDTRKREVSNPSDKGREPSSQRSTSGFCALLAEFWAVLERGAAVTAAATASPTASHQRPVLITGTLSYQPPGSRASGRAGVPGGPGGVRRAPLGRGAFLEHEGLIPIVTPLAEQLRRIRQLVVDLQIVSI